ncbi:Canalicular multispecific organic anion transporter 2, partial [Stegodyphus mimosarum]
MDYQRQTLLTGWPDSDIMKDYSTRYRDGFDLVLKKINFSVRRGENTGIVGRTITRKSSLTLSLFGIIEAAGSCINIDSLKIADMGLYGLKSRITIIPQDPVLFSGTLRRNLDPFDWYSDADIWALDHARMKSFKPQCDFF